MRQDEDGDVVRRVVAPPADPRCVPGSGAAAEHLAAHDVGADILHHLIENFRIGIADATFPALLSEPAFGHEHPLVEAHPPFPDRILQTLVGSSDKPVQRDGDVAGDLAHETTALPLGRQTSATTPVPKVLVSATVNSVGVVPASKRCLPLPTTIG